MARKITKEQLQHLIKEGVQNLHRRTMLENEKRELMKELSNILFENEVASPEVLEIMDGYLEAALWAEEERIGSASISDISDNSKIDTYKDIKLFLSQAGTLIDGIDPIELGRGIWFTRNGHGTGLWDMGLGDVGKKLSNIARPMGEKYVYVNDDGEIEIV